MRWRSLHLRLGLTIIAACLAGLITAESRAQESDPEATPLPDVFVEAYQEANVRSGPGIEYPQVGEIGAGAYYRALARHEFVPWLQIDYPGAATAWVYQDVVQVTGNANALPLISDFPPLGTLTPTPILTRAPASATAILASATVAPAAPSEASATPTATPGESASPAPPTAPAEPSPTPTMAGPTAQVLAGPINARYGPGLEYPLVAELPEGARYLVTGLHAIVPWVEIALPDSATGRGWIYRDLVEISGDTGQTPVISSFNFNLPDLTPTPQTVVVVNPPWADGSSAPGALAETLGEQMNAYLLEQGFDPYSHEFGSVFLMDLQTGDTFTLNDGIAYSGMSLTKIPILATYFYQHDEPLDGDAAYLIADTMMCSENLTTNALLADIGDGDAVKGAQRVTALMQALDLRRTFIMAPYVTGDDQEHPNVGTVKTDADQIRAQPDLYNQVTPKDLGWLLASIYQCAMDGSGPLMERFPDDFTVQECRHMLRAMDANEIGVFIEAGVPDGTTVIHKHGWIGDTYGDAGIVIGPHGAYVLVVTLYQDEWLLFEKASPVIAELSRMAWNALNPDAPLDEVHIGVVSEECNPREDPVMNALLTSELPAPGPVIAAAPDASATPGSPGAPSPTPTFDEIPVG